LENFVTVIEVREQANDDWRATNISAPTKIGLNPLATSCKPLSRNGLFSRNALNVNFTNNK
jgi:hypothetical protein